MFSEMEEVLELLHESIPVSIMRASTCVFPRSTMTPVRASQMACVFLVQLLDEPLQLSLVSSL